MAIRAQYASAQLARGTAREQPAHSAPQGSCAAAHAPWFVCEVISEVIRLAAPRTLSVSESSPRALFASSAGGGALRGVEGEHRVSSVKTHLELVVVPLDSPERAGKGICDAWARLIGANLR